MGGRATKPVERVSAAAVNASRAELRAAQRAPGAAAAEAAASAVSAPTHRRQLAPSPLDPRAPPADLGGPTPELDPELIKAINQWGPVVRESKPQPARTMPFHVVDPSEERLHALEEVDLYKVFSAFRTDPKYSVEAAVKEYNVKAEDLEVALKYLRAPRIERRKGIKYGYWDESMEPST